MKDWKDIFNIRRMVIAAFVVVILFFLLFVTSCKTCKPIVEYRDSVRVEYKLDSTYVYVHDSIFRDRWRNGDTVFVQVEKYKTLFKDKIVQVHDTIRTSEKEVQQVEVVKPFYRGCTIALWVLVALLAIGVTIRILIRVYLKK